MNALRRAVDHVADGFKHLLVTERLDVVLFRAEQEVQRHHAGLRRNRRRVGGRYHRKIQIAGLHKLQQLGFLPKLRAGKLVDQHGALAQLLQLRRKNVVGDAVAGVELLVVREAIMLGFLRDCAGGEQDGGSGNRREYRFPWIPHDAFPLWFDFPQSNHQRRQIVNKVSKFSACPA